MNKCFECNNEISAKRKFCSRKCYHNCRKREQQGQPLPSKKDPVLLRCDHCGKQIKRIPSAVNNHNFCARFCYKSFYGPIFSEQNRKRNKTMWQSRAFREKIAQQRRDVPKWGELKSYRKYLGRHEHRIVAEAMLGRELLPGEIVHHKNGDKRDNRPENLHVTTRQEHIKIHLFKGGDLK